jgi:sec-independent protein translocase protein TatA
MPSVGPMELIIVLVVALLILGPKRLPDAGRSLGRGVREFKESLSPSGDVKQIDQGEARVDDPRAA